MQDLSEFLIILGFAPTESPSPEKLKKRWKDRCKTCHPDIGGDEEEFKKVTHAYKMLIDPEYAFKYKDKPKVVLDLKIQYPVTFEEAFYGTELITSFSVTEFDDEYLPIKKDVLEIETIKLTLRPGSFEVQPILLPQIGMRKGALRGNVIVLPLVSPHKRFKIEKAGIFMTGYNIVADEQVPLSAMLKGGRMLVETMKGPRKIRFKPGTAPGERISISGCGCLGGDHVVVVHPIFPDKQKLKSKEWSEFKIDWDAKDDGEDNEETLLLGLFEKLSAKEDDDERVG